MAGHLQRKGSIIKMKLIQITLSVLLNSCGKTGVNPAELELEAISMGSMG